nr:methylmalonyl-CoA mutase [Bacteriovoracaceae bacterium]
GSGTALSPHIKPVVEFLKSQNFDLVLVETSGIGQASDEITTVANKAVYVMTPEYGASTQLEKIEMLEMADFIVINKFEKARSEDALRDVRKQYRRNHNLFHDKEDSELPIYGTMASRFNDVGVNALFYDLAQSLDFDVTSLKSLKKEKAPQEKPSIVPASRAYYLREVATICRKYNAELKKKVVQLEKFECVLKTGELFKNADLEKLTLDLKQEIKPEIFSEIKVFEEMSKKYQSGVYSYQVRDKNIEVETKYESLSRNFISKVGTPKFRSLADTYFFIASQNLPGFFPFASGIFPFKKKDEEPKRQFAGEGGPLRTNKRFHYLCKNDDFKRLSTAFDSVTLYGEDPDIRPDIYGKIGESGVSICTLEDMEDLYRGFELTHPNTSVSMTINGPAPIILAMFMNTAINQELKGEDQNNFEKRLQVMQKVRGTVQADILKEDQAQNTCIFSLDFALKIMGDVQSFFSQHHIKNYYTVSISGYHIAEAGANPITQLAFTLANGFTYVEYYLSRGIPIDSFCENLSFFFSNGLDPEYTVIGRVARKIWAVTMRDKYGANIKSQKLKYHIQTSGRSLHAQEIDFNDIRTTLQAFLALSDNCNSLHTNAYDEAITTPTEESVRRAMAIQLIINREFGLNKSDNPLQGSFIYDELAEIVEEAVLKEFENISDKGGVLGAMESMYQRSKIQEESLYYETLKSSGEFPIIGVNTYLLEGKNATAQEIEMTRASNDEKDAQIMRLKNFQAKHKNQSKQALQKLEQVALTGGNIFEELLSTVRVCSLGEISAVLYKVGGRYRRNM